VPEDRGPLPTEFELETCALALRGVGEGARLGMKYLAKVALNFLAALILLSRKMLDHAADCGWPDANTVW
jgi:hypothetical protein